MDKLSLGDRMKCYENSFRNYLPLRLPVILRVDGKAFHSYTRGCKKPFDENLNEVMDFVAIKLCEEIQGTQIAYIQSDEISIFIHNFKKINTSSWFGNNIQKMVSISAAIASTIMTLNSEKIFGHTKIAHFDSRVFIVPERDLNNYFIWRQQDFMRNSIQMLARSLYSHKECHNKNTPQLQEMCFEKGQNWNDLPDNLKRGRCVFKKTYFSSKLKDNLKSDIIIRNKWEVDNNIPIFSKDVNYINKYLEVEKETV